MDKIAITTGDPNGIGAEITIKALRELDLPKDKIVLVSNKNILNFYGKLDKNYEIIEIPYSSDNITPGKITHEAGEFSFQSLKKVCEIRPKAIVTAPVAKNAMYLAGHKFNGQTEVLQKYLAHNNQKAEMLFTADGFRVLLLTRHIPLKKLSLDFEILEKKIKDITKILSKDYNVEHPKLALCGFNPHAGEDGILGTEEQEILIPLAKK